MGYHTISECDEYPDLAECPDCGDLAHIKNYGMSGDFFECRCGLIFSERTLAMLKTLEPLEVCDA